MSQRILDGEVGRSRGQRAPDPAGARAGATAVLGADLAPRAGDRDAGAGHVSRCSAKGEVMMTSEPNAPREPPPTVAVLAGVEPVSAMTRLTIWLGIGGLLLAGCATLDDMRAAKPDARTVAGIPIEKQEAVARCIQDRAYEEIGIMFAIIQETRQEACGWHVIGRARQLPVHITWDV